MQDIEARDAKRVVAGRAAARALVSARTRDFHLGADADTGITGLQRRQKEALRQRMALPRWGSRADPARPMA